MIHKKEYLQFQIKSVCINYDEFLKQIEFDQTKCQYINHKILFDIYNFDKLNNSNDEFVYSQIFISILLQTDPIPNDINEFISLCRNQYKGNKFQLNILREFEINYTSENAIWWFTRDTFITQLLNKALRIRNTDLIFFLRFFLHDIQNQLRQQFFLASVSQVYRHQLISNEELQLIKDSVGQFISINNFLLTKVNRDSAMPFSNITTIPDGFQSVLFTIITDLNFDLKKPFAKITSLSYSNTNQDEVLFMLGSIFQIKDIYQDENDLWVIEIMLCNESNIHLKSIFDNYKNDDDDIDLLSFGYILEKKNKLDEAKKYFCRLFSELSDNDERICTCLLNIGNIDFIRKD